MTTQNLDDVCPMCQLDGRSSKFRLFQINFKEAISLCEAAECTYPMTSGRAVQCIVQRQVSAVPVSLAVRKSPKRKRVANNSPIKQNKSPLRTKLRISKFLDSKITQHRIEASGFKKNCRLLVGGARPKSGCSEVYIQWENKDALCWLDILLCLFVQCESVKTARLRDCGIVSRLCAEYDHALSIQKKSSVVPVMSLNNVIEQAVATPGGITGRASVPFRHDKGATSMSERDFASKLIGISTTLTSGVSSTSASGRPAASLAATGAGSPRTGERRDRLVACELTRIMEESRETVWRALNPTLKCERGRHHSPVFAAPLMINDDEGIRELFHVDYSSVFECSNCGIKKVNTLTEVLLTVTSPLLPEFSPPAVRTSKQCPSCSADNQTLKISPIKLPQCLFMHFVNGVPSLDVASLDFTAKTGRYRVSSIVQHLTNPDHFVVWIRHPRSNMWMLCDDMRGPECRFDHTQPTVPPAQVHMLLWERLAQARPSAGFTREGGVKRVDDAVASVSSGEPSAGSLRETRSCSRGESRAVTGTNSLLRSPPKLDGSCARRNGVKTREKLDEGMLDPDQRKMDQGGLAAGEHIVDESGLTSSPHKLKESRSSSNRPKKNESRLDSVQHKLDESRSVAGHHKIDASALLSDQHKMNESALASSQHKMAAGGLSSDLHKKESDLSSSQHKLDGSYKCVSDDLNIVDRVKTRRRDSEAKKKLLLNTVSVGKDDKLDESLDVSKTMRCRRSLRSRTKKDSVTDKCEEQVNEQDGSGLISSPSLGLESKGARGLYEKSWSEKASSDVRDMQNSGLLSGLPVVSNMPQILDSQRMLMKIHQRKNLAKIDRWNGIKQSAVKSDEVESAKSVKEPEEPGEILRHLSSRTTRSSKKFASYVPKSERVPARVEDEVRTNAELASPAKRKLPDSELFKVPFVQSVKRTRRRSQPGKQGAAPDLNSSVPTETVDVPTDMELSTDDAVIGCLNSGVMHERLLRGDLDDALVTDFRPNVTVPSISGPQQQHQDLADVNQESLKENTNVNIEKETSINIAESFFDSNIDQIDDELDSFFNDLLTLPLENQMKTVDSTNDSKNPFISRDTTQRLETAAYLPKMSENEILSDLYRTLDLNIQEFPAFAL